MVRKLLTLAEQWRDYEHRVLPRGAGHVQRSETRKAFYGGAAALFAIMRSIESDDVSEAEGIELLDDLHRELDAFLAELVQAKL